MIRTHFDLFLQYDPKCAGALARRVGAVREERSESRRLVYRMNLFSLPGKAEMDTGGGAASGAQEEVLVPGEFFWPRLG